MPDSFAPDRSIAITPGPSMQRLLLRAGPDALDALAPTLGLAPSREACRAVVAEPRSALWLGPDEWLLLAPPDGWNLAALHAAAGAAPCSLVDVSHRQVAIRLDGSGAAELLNAFCPLDLHPTAFPVGTCTRTILAKAEIVLWRTAPDRFHLEVWRSFAAYARALLADAAGMMAA